MNDLLLKLPLDFRVFVNCRRFLTFILFLFYFDEIFNKFIIFELERLLYSHAALQEAGPGTELPVVPSASVLSISETPTPAPVGLTDEQLAILAREQRKTTQISNLDSQVKGIEIRLETARADRNTTNEKLKAAVNEIAAIDKQLAKLVPELESVTAKAGAFDGRVSELSANIDR